jgi:S-adenosylmethionine:tRNA ribosyltransferase-isomerase
MPKTTDFDYTLPEGSIAQNPLQRRDSSRLLVLSRSEATFQHRKFSDISDYLNPGDVLVANNSRVIPARLFGHKVETMGKVEILLLEKQDGEEWRVLVGGRNVNPGVSVQIHDKVGQDTDLAAEVVSAENGPIRRVRFNQALGPFLDQVGHTPLPPYIHASLDDPERYQTIYAKPEGSAAAPTAGLHFSPELLLRLRDKGVIFEEITLHVGLDTFKPVETEEVEEHSIHSEWCRISPESAERINRAKLAGGRIIAVGTTSTRVLETAALRSAGVTGPLSGMSRLDDRSAGISACAWQPVVAYEGKTDLYIYPGYRFRAVDVMVTNFHLPKSSLVMMVSAFASRNQILSAYRTAVEKGYRFYSFGDAMLIE